MRAHTTGWASNQRGRRDAAPAAPASAGGPTCPAPSPEGGRELVRASTTTAAGPGPAWKLWDAATLGLIVTHTRGPSAQLVRRAAPVAVRRGLRRTKRGWESRRRDLFERFDSDRYSRPALYDMERTLARHLPQHGGFFVEAGANDGYTQSNTYWLERFCDWQGILIEPIPALAESCSRLRRGSWVVRAALVEPDHDGSTVTMAYGDLTSLVRASRPSRDQEQQHLRRGVIDESDIYDVEAPARTLSSILDQERAPTVDLLSLDVEGYEAAALRGLDLDRHAPRFILVEVLVEDGASRGPVDDLLADRYVLAASPSHHDLLYRRRDISS